jgi:hypothetical protein
MKPSNMKLPIKNLDSDTIQKLIIKSFLSSLSFEDPSHNFLFFDEEGTYYFVPNTAAAF